MELARRMNLRVGQEDIADVFDGQLAENFGITFEELKEQGYAYMPITYHKHEKTGRVLTQKPARLNCIHWPWNN